MSQQGSNMGPEPGRDEAERCEQGSFPKDSSPLIQAVLRAARARPELRTVVGDRLHDKLVDHCLKAGMPDDPAAWLFAIASRECAKCEKRRARQRRLEDEGANLVARCAHSELTDEQLGRLRQEVLDLAVRLPAHYRRTIEAALHSGNWVEFCRALGTDSSHALRALLRAAQAAAQRRDAEK